MKKCFSEQKRFLNAPANPAIVWLRQDLRLADNPALQAASNHPFLLCTFGMSRILGFQEGLHGGGFIKA
jgi:hypothetical protein